ncbi:HEAT repeat domain-containing protein [Mycobacterium sp. smrl_JER01]|uniref:HEAT repeat domain-containing protein n=1 Tax=Mycobacterium sp. smrl_JER01 TaxID=3402633 RepID=UPI003AC03FB6
MKPRHRWYSELRALSSSEWNRFLGEHSGLPGPRANTELAIAYAELADQKHIVAAAGDSDEYLAMCGAVALGARASEPRALATLHRLASDPRWRVREGVALGLQLLGDAGFGDLERIATAWVGDEDPLVRRAAVAAICEPRLLGNPHAAAVAIDVCRNATASITRTSRSARRDPALRALRQALGYCWSVAVAAAPDTGLPAFHELDRDDPDVAWIVNQNLRKKRLARLL